jgi:hypothetical protein
MLARCNVETDLGKRSDAMIDATAEFRGALTAIGLAKTEDLAATALAARNPVEGQPPVPTETLDKLDKLTASAKRAFQTAGQLPDTDSWKEQMGHGNEALSQAKELAKEFAESRSDS